VRLERLEAQMRDLTGRVEEFTNQVEQVRHRVEQINSDIDVRFSQGGGAMAAGAPPRGGGRASRQDATGRTAAFASGPSDESDDDDPMRPPRKPSGAAGLMPPGGYAPGSPTPIFGTLTPPDPYSDYHSGPAGAPAELTNAPARPGSEGALPRGTTAEQYNYAFGLLKQANYPAAETALKTFIDRHPKDAMAGNAQYWLGETYYARGKYMEAASTFAEGYKRYPKSAKAPDALLKLGMSLARADQKQNACVVLTQLDHDFPHPGASIKNRAATEKKRLGC
jgi:tol-pal system protein YbgF